jgi:hypothetical protein
MSRPSHLPTSHKEVYSISMELMIGPKLGISLHKEKGKSGFKPYRDFDERKHGVLCHFIR